MHRIVGKVGKVVPILYGECCCSGIGEFCLDILIYSFYFVQMWMRVAYGIDKSVTTETAERGDSFGSVIAAITPIPFSVFIYFSETLIDPIPYATSLCHRFGFEDFPIILQSAYTVSHGM